jgi:hypothetical protein
MERNLELLSMIASNGVKLGAERISGRREAEEAQAL